jgi:hypothetical protein
MQLKIAVHLFHSLYLNLSGTLSVRHMYYACYYVLYYVVENQLEVYRNLKTCENQLKLRY